MIEIKLAQQHLDTIGYAHYNNKINLVAKAEHLFNQARLYSQLGQLWSKLTGSSSSLLDLKTIENNNLITGRFHQGVQVVSVAQIRGSEGRTTDFDRHFNPLQTHTQQRWMSVAKASLSDINLPPIQVIQVGDDYYVRDGHHRVSVAKALRQTFIDAEVTVWQVRPRVPVQKPCFVCQPTCCPA
jgi:hypothetical protein